MSDVEQILDANFQRVQWAREVEAGLAAELERQPEKKQPVTRRKRRSSEKFRAIRTAVLACAMFAGAGAAFVGIGLAEGDALTVGIGLLIVSVFISSGARLDGLSRSV